MLSTVWGLDGDHLWAAGNRGVVLRRHDGYWRFLKNARTSEGLSVIWGTAPRDLYVFGDSDVHRYDGARWSPTLYGEHERAIGVFKQGGRAHVLTMTGRIYRHSGDEWEMLDALGTKQRRDNNPLSAFWWSDDTLWATSSGGSLFKHDERGWSRLIDGHSGGLWSVAAAGDQVIVVGSEGRIHRRVGHRWRNPPPMTKAVLHAVAVAGDTVIAGGEKGQVIIGQGDAWEVVDTGLDDMLRGAWTDGEQHLVVGDDGAIARFTAEGWRAEASGTDVGLNDVWAAEDGTAFAVGDDGTALYFDGSSWRLTKTDTEADLFAVHGRNDQVYAVGLYGTVLRFDGGGGWRKLPKTTLEFIGSVQVIEGGAVVAATPVELLRLDGDTWRRRPIEAGWSSSTAIDGKGAVLAVTRRDLWRCESCLDETSEDSSAWVEAPPLDIAFEEPEAVVPVGRELLEALQDGPWRLDSSRDFDPFPEARRCLAVQSKAADHNFICWYPTNGVVGVHPKRGTIASRDYHDGWILGRDGTRRSKTVLDSLESSWRWAADLADQGYVMPRWLFRVTSLGLRRMTAVLGEPLAGWIVHLDLQRRDLRALLVTPDNRTSYLLGRHRIGGEDHDAVIAEVVLSADGRYVIVSIEEHEIGDSCFCTDDPIMIRIVGRLPERPSDR